MREAVLRSGRIALRIRLNNGAVANVLWNALPVYCVAEVEGRAIAFTVPIDPSAATAEKAALPKGGILFSPSKRAVIIPFEDPAQATGSFEQGECIARASAVDDVSELRLIKAGDRIALLEVDS